MAVPLSETGGVFRRLGRLGYVLLAANEQQQASVDGLDAFLDQFPDEDRDDHDAIAAPLEIALDSLTRSQNAGIVGQLPSLATAVLLRMVSADQPAAGRATAPALRELIRQMVASSDTVARCTVTSVATVLSSPANTGNGAVVLSTKRGDGLTNENAIAESGRLQCSADSYTGGASQGSEPFEYVGTEARAGVLDYDWPDGSGAVTALTSRLPADGPLSNQDFEDWSGSPLGADHWTLTVGTWATDAVRTATPHTGTYSLKFVHGATLTSFYQAFATGDLTPLQSYAVNFWMRRVSSAPTTGVLTVELVDGSNVLTQDEQGANNSFTVDLTALTASYVAYSGVFRLSSLPPSEARLRFRISTALGTNDVLLDDVAIAPLTPLYLGGPGAAVFSGATPWKLRDGWSVVTTNDRAGSEFGATFQTLFDRLFGMRSLGLLLPTSATPTVRDVLITNPPGFDTLTVGLVAYYRLDGTLLDSWTAGRTLTGSSPTYTQPGLLGAAALSGGSASRTPLGGLQTAGPVSVSAWVKIGFTSPSGNGGAVLFGGTDGIQVITSGGSAHAQFGPTSGGFETTVVLTDGWHHLCVTHDGGATGTAYLDGASIGTGAWALPDLAAAAFSLDPVDGFTTPIDEVAVWSRELTAAEVAALYNDGAGFDPTA